MPKGISLHIGLNTLNPQEYRGTSDLRGCENDAIAMQSIADSQGFTSSLLLSKEATTRNVVIAIKQAVGSLQAGDTFLMTYSGHGGQVWDQSLDESATEGVSLQGWDTAGKPIMWGEGGKDETLCLYDRMYWDDELNRQLAQFASGVKIVMVADCCHAASNYKGDGETDTHSPPPARGLGLDKSMEILERNKAAYQEVRRSQDFLKANSGLRASLIQLAACKDTQLSGDALPNDPHPLGVFTSRLVNVWDNGHFKGNYQQLVQQIGSLIEPGWNQTPQYLTEGSANPVFEQQKPFTI